MLGALATLFTLLSWLALGVALGFLVAELYQWARFGEFAGPRVMDAVLGSGHRLPRTSWVGLEQALEWSFTQPVFLITGAALLVVTLLLAALARTFGSVHALLLRRRLVRDVRRTREARAVVQPDRVMAHTDPLPSAIRILQAYEDLDRSAERKSSPVKVGPTTAMGSSTED